MSPSFVLHEKLTPEFPRINIPWYQWLQYIISLLKLLRLEVRRKHMTTVRVLQSCRVHNHGCNKVLLPMTQQNVVEKKKLTLRELKSKRSPYFGSELAVSASFAPVIKPWQFSYHFSHTTDPVTWSSLKSSLQFGRLSMSSLLHCSQSSDIKKNKISNYSCSACTLFLKSRPKNWINLILLPA